MGEVPIHAGKAAPRSRFHEDRTRLKRLFSIPSLRWKPGPAIEDSFVTIFLVPNFTLRANLIFNYSLLLLLSFGGLLLAYRRNSNSGGAPAQCGA